MKKRDKKGLSGIVITLIIVVLGLVAVGVVWGVIRNLIKSGSEEVQIGNLITDLDITNAYEFNEIVNVSVTRNSGKGNLAQIKFILSDGGDSEVVTQDVTLAELESQTFSLNPIKLLPETILTVSVAPVIKLNDGTETVGDITDTYTLSSNHIPGGEYGEENDNPFTCTPNCIELECGLDPLCGQSCGTCESLSTCTNGVCVSPDCVPESAEITCTGVVCGKEINNCGAEISCDSCETGKFCMNNECLNITVLNSGIIEDIWPGSSGFYFGSSSLPIDTSFKGDYVKFVDSAEIRCLQVVIYQFPVEGYAKSHIGFNFETSILVGETYEIFATSEECQAS